MDEKIIKRKNRQVGIAQCILEGKTIRETAQECGVSKDTVKRDLVDLFYDGYGEDEIQIKKSQILAWKALKEIEDRRNGQN